MAFYEKRVRSLNLNVTLQAPQAIWGAVNVGVYLNVGREGHVDFLSVRGDTIQQEGVMHGAVPGCFKLVEGPRKKQMR